MHPFIDRLHEITTSGGSCTRAVRTATSQTVTTDELVQRTAIMATENGADTAAQLAAAIVVNAIAATTAALMAVEQRPVRAGMRARNRPYEVRRELGRILGVQRERLQEHCRVNAQSRAECPPCLVRQVSMHRQTDSSRTRWLLHPHAPGSVHRFAAALHLPTRHEKRIISSATLEATLGT